MNLSTLTAIQTNFVKELQRAKDGKQSSLSFIKHQLPSFSLVKENDVFQVLVIGGSVNKNALIRKTANGIKILSSKQKDQPPFSTKTTFLEFIEKELSPTVSVLVVNFAYPLSPVYTTKKLEGKFISGSKENKFHGMEKENVCAEIEKYILKKMGRSIQVSIANDTICLLLAGLNQRPWNQLACGIVGTGSNTAFFLEEKILINLESANFDKFPQTPEGKYIDASSAYPRTALFEKEISGAYLFMHFNEKVKNMHLPLLKIDSTKELTILAQENSIYSKTALDTLYHSAELVAAQVAGIAAFLQRNLTFIMEGSLFWEGYMYKTHVEKTLQKLNLPSKIIFKHVHNSPLVGAAKLV